MTTKATLSPAQKAITETRVLVAAKPATVTLEMSLEDAKVLGSITRSIGGCPEGPRGAFDRLASALDGIGIDRVEAEKKFPMDGFYFVR